MRLYIDLTDYEIRTLFYILNHFIPKTKSGLKPTWRPVTIYKIANKFRRILLTHDATPKAVRIITKVKK